MTGAERERRRVGRGRLDVAESLAWAALLGLAVAAVASGFSAALRAATAARTVQPAWIWGLPVAGALLGVVLQRWGGPLRGGSRAVFDAAEGHGHPLSSRLGPVVFLGTICTHLFGGSAGREGAAVLLGAWVAEAACRLGRGVAVHRQQLLLAGMAAGFSAVFGTPVAATLYALECTGHERVRTDALLPVGAAAAVAALAAERFGVVRASYIPEVLLPMSGAVLLRWGVLALGVALVAGLFVWACEAVDACLSRLIPALPWRLAAGGGLLLVAVLALGGDQRYLGLGEPTLDAALRGELVPNLAFLFKLGFTAITLGAGFVGGEVTPLFFVGATFGNVAARLLDLPPAMGAGVGMVATFAAATKTPVTAVVLAVELLGRAVWPHVLLVSALACALRRNARGTYGVPARHAPH